MAIALDVENINKKFNSKKILNNVSFQIKSGHIFGLAGLNGIGKTTIIKIILSLIEEDSGKISIFGIDHKKPEARKHICYLPERFYPSQYLTGYEFLNLSLSFYDKKLDKKKAIHIANELSLDPKALELVIKKYSKGMGQKLGLMYCLLSEAKLLILDEPMTGLDPNARVILKNTLKNYVKDGEKTVFFSSHILDDMEEICNEIAILHNGKIFFNGKPLEFIKKYNETKAENAFLKCINK